TGPRIEIEEEAAPGPMRFSYPSWSPDGATLLVLGARMSGEAVASSGLYRVAADRPGVITPLYEDPRRAPIYAFWDPTGRNAAVLVNEGEGIGLGLIDVGGGRFRNVGTGLPFYFAWRKDGAALLAHVGGSARDNRAAQLSLIELGRAADADPKIEKLTDQPAGFRAPAWSPDGSRFAYAGFGNGGASSLFVREIGGETRNLGPVSSRLVFSWTPDGGSVTVSESAVPGGTLLAGVNLIRLSDGRREPLYAGPLGAFFWSPDGARLLVAAPDFDTGEWRWLVVEREGVRARELVRFLPNPEFQMLLLHFDQYALSHRVWAPDSRHFVFAAYPSGVAAQSPGLAVSTVWMVDTREARSTRLGDGRSAFWSPR
ncbi:MAG: TolB family protein, partial [Candidatus Binatia bacterium]